MQAMTKTILSVSPNLNLSHRLGRHFLVLRRDRIGQLFAGNTDQDFGGLYDFFLYRYNLNFQLTTGKAALPVCAPIKIYKKTTKTRITRCKTQKEAETHKTLV